MRTVSGCDDETETLGSQSAHQNLQSHNDVKCDTLKARADEILAGYQVSHSVDDLEIVIGLYEETLRLRPAGHERQAEAFNDLGVALYYFCFHQKVDEARANRAIELLREGLRLRPRGHPLRHRSLHDLARTLNLIQYEQLGGTIDIVEESAALNREALQLRPPGHPERLNSLGGLANDLGRIFQHTGDVDIQAKTVRIRREALEICPPDHPLRYMALDTLGGELKGSFEITGDSETLAEAIVLTREAIQMCPMEHPERWMVLDNLSHLLWFRFAYQGHSYSLPEAIDLSREALQLLSEAHPKRPTIMGNLADLLLTRFRHHGDGNALTEPITLLREALDMRTSGSCSDDHALQCLADALELKYDDDGDLASLLEAATLRRDTLLLRPIGNWRRHVSLEGLAQVLNKIGDESWPEALSCYLEALQVCPVGCPDRARLLSGLSRCYLNPTSQYFNFSEGITCLSKAYANSISPVSGRLKSAIVDLQQLEAAYGASMKGGHAKPRPYEDERVLNLYTQVMGLLPLAANFGLDHSARLQALTGCDEISRNAAARAMLLGGVSQAVQMLEQGRGVFWTQTLHLRATAFDRVPRDDCQELQRMLRLFEHGVRRVESLKQSVIQHERELEERRQLNESVQALILKIRGYPGLDRFLLPPVFGSLLSSLPDGYVVIVNVSKLGHHAFLLRRSTGLATGLELKPFRAGFDCATLRTRLPREGALHARAMRINKGTVSKFEEVLSVVWTSIVHPVLQALGLHHAQGRARPRLWWCVTGELGFLPIHAAGRYCGANTVCTADYIVSSYIPTIASLIKARHSWTPIERSDLAGLLICESSTAENSAAYLSDVFNEVVAVRECFASIDAVVLNEPAAHTSASELRSLLEKTPAHVLHMACHGIQESDPLKSAFLMHDGRLSIEDVLQLHLPHACLAFLSACQTAKGDQNAPDQAVHLAASMLFCGFRSVVGTMWSMCDEDGPNAEGKTCWERNLDLFRNMVPMRSDDLITRTA